MWIEGLNRNFENIYDGSKDVESEIHKEINIRNIGICVQADQHIGDPLDGRSSQTPRRFSS